MPDMLDFGDGQLSQPGNVYLLEADVSVANRVADWLLADGHSLRRFEHPEALLEQARQQPPHVVCLAVGKGERTPFHWLDAMAALSDIPLIILGSKVPGRLTDREAKLLETAHEVLGHPLDRLRVRAAVRSGTNQSRFARNLARLAHDVRMGGPTGSLVGSSPAMESLFDQVRRVLESDAPVFLAGESGTGKELVARAMHQGGRRSGGPFVALNCAAIPESLQESELFGHERGAFTGAVATSKGKFEQADGGTLFLDEVGDLSAPVQAKLLRVLQEGTFYRVGGAKPLRVDVRIISATHRDVEAMVRAGTFRNDLFYRIVVYPVQIPPLRERREDIPQLIMHFLRKYARESDGRIKPVEPEALDLLCSYAWPGNVRELENAVRRAVLASDDIIRLDALPPAITHSPEVQRPPDTVADAPGPDEEIVPLAVLERRAILHAMQVVGGNMSEAAKRLGIGRATLYRKLAKDE